MPILNSGEYTLDYTDDGAGDPVILVHSSACGYWQWRKLTTALQPKYRVLAVNLFGYGGTSAWPENRRLSLADQAQLVLALANEVRDSQVSLVGHSYGGTVAMHAALELQRRVARLILLEPNPFNLIADYGRKSSLQEVLKLSSRIKTDHPRKDWESLGAYFADYWNAPGTWDAMPAERRTSYLRMLPALYHEMVSIMEDHTPPERWLPYIGRTLLVTAVQTKQPIQEIARILRKAWPGLREASVEQGGHMAPLTRPDLVNPIIGDFLAL